VSDNPLAKVGYKRPPLHARFKPGTSGNPSGRTKGSRNVKTLFHKVLNERVSLREGSTVHKVTKAEAILRRLVINALQGDARSVATLFRLAEQTGQLGEDATSTITVIERIVVDADVRRLDARIPGGSDISREDR
jgi:hypothetical protein